ncbi:MAG: endo-1,4-beta-xylanase, partial [Candidatus Flemingiibacterium sp.]
MTREEYLLKPFLDCEDYTEERTRAGIENHRKGFATIKVVDADGNPVKGASVSVKQKTHDFKYGANIFMLDEFESEEKNAEYRRVFAESFNFATLPFYWDTLEPEEGKPRYAKDSPKVYRRPAPDLCLEYCEANGITPKAHCLHYDHFEPEWLKKYPVEKQWKLLEKRMRECSERYSGRIHGWEVTNESWWQTSTTPMYYDPLYMERSFNMAERYFPENELICNEGGEPFRDAFLYNRNPYFMQVERAKLKGARIDTVGFQYHVWSDPTNEERVVAKQFDPINMFKVFDTFASFNCPFQMTEVTIPCHDPHSKEAEELQAEVLRRLYTIWFGVPNMEAIIYWNLVDGYAYNAEPGDFSNGENRLAGGLMHFDVTPKPALKALRKLFGETWRTECSLTAGEGGTARFKGFYGSYDVEVTSELGTASCDIHLQKQSNPNQVFTVKLK